MPPITFTDEDFKGVDYRQQDDSMVISADIDRFTIWKTLVDQGSSVDIFYWKTFKAMRIAETEMMPYDDHVVGFSGERVGTKGYIELYTTFGQGKNTRTIRIRYLVIDANTSYNILLNRLSINQLMAIVSTPHLAMKFLSKTGDILTVHVDQNEARECYAESLQVEPLRNDISPKRKSSRKDHSPREARLMLVEPTVVLVDLDPQATEDRLDAEHNTAVGTTMAAVEAEIMHATRKKNMDMFAWTPADMPGVSSNVTPTDCRYLKKLDRSPRRRGIWAMKTPSNKGRGREASVGRIHTGGPIHDLASQCRHGHQAEQQLEDVRRLQKSQQHMFEGYLFPPKH